MQAEVATAVLSLHSSATSWLVFVPQMFDIVEEVYDALTPKLEDILQKAVQLTGGDPSQMQMATTQL